MIGNTIAVQRVGGVRQFSVFVANRLGRLHDLVGILGAQNVHVLALAILDATDHATIRLVTDDPDQAGSLMRQHDFPYAESDLVVVELTATTDLPQLMAALLEAELNVNYLYSFIPHPEGKSLLALSVEDPDLAEQALKRHQFRILRQADISR